MNTKGFTTELLNKFLLTEEAEAITKLETIKVYFRSVLDGNQSFSNDWGKGYREASRDIAKTILEYLEDDH
jgi:hypothetical protein